MRTKSNILIIGILALIILPSVSFAQPQFFGQTAYNGDIIGISQTGFLGVYSPINNGQSINNNIIDLTFYNVQYSQNVSIHISYSQVIGNKTEIVRNQTINFFALQYEIINKNISLYLFKGSFFVDLSYDNVNFTFQYSPVASLFPVNIQTYGQLALYSIILLAVSLFIFVLGTLTAEAMIKRMLYFPKMSLSSIVLSLLLGFIAFFIIYNSIYLKILSIPYYYFVLPVYFMSIAIELQLRSAKTKEAIFFGLTDSGKIERIFINKDKNKDSKNSEYYTGKIPIIDDKIQIGKKQNKTVVIDSSSFIKAFKRLLGFYTFLEIPIGMIEYPNIKNDRIYFFCSIVNNSKNPMLELQKSEYHFIRHREMNKPKTYKINASSNAHIGDVLSVMTDLKQIDSLARENNEYSKENKELHAKIINGSIAADYKFIKEASEILKPLNKLIPDFKEKIQNEENKEESNNEPKTDNSEGMYK
jgi:hypothetical protein